MGPKSIFTLILLSIPTAASAQGQTPSVNPFMHSDCVYVACRPAGATFGGRVSDGSIRTYGVGGVPYVYRSGTIELFAGETLNFDFPDAGGRLGAPRHMAAPPSGHSAKMLTASLQYRRQDFHSLLTLRQTFPMPMVMTARIGMAGLDGMDYKDREICLAPSVPLVIDIDAAKGDPREVLIYKIALLPSGPSGHCGPVGHG